MLRFAQHDSSFHLQFGRALAWEEGYDANGCMVTRASQVVRYDPERRPVRVDENGATL